jgi:redox-sensitive bicupin YhaK (pirin superfamily)
MGAPLYRLRHGTAAPLRPALGEPVRCGPFVMNTAKEVEQALVELRKGTFVK